MFAQSLQLDLDPVMQTWADQYNRYYWLKMVTTPA